MTRKVLIITIIDKKVEEPYLFRVMQNVDEQTLRDYHHVIIDRSLKNNAQTLIPLRSHYYQENVWLVVEGNLKGLLKDHKYEYIAFHSVHDKWGAFFLEKMVFELENNLVPEVAICQANSLTERVNGNLIQTDNMFDDAKLPVGYLPLKISVFENTSHIQILYSFTALRDFNLEEIDALPVYLLTYILDNHDILVIPEYMAYKHKDIDVPEVDLEHQRCVNSAVRLHPYMAG